MRRFDALDPRHETSRLGQELLITKFMDILDQYGGVLVRQDMIQPVVEDDDLDCPVVDYPPELAAPPEPADDQPPELAYAEQKQRHLRQDHVRFATWCRVRVQAKG